MKTLAFLINLTTAGVLAASPALAEDSARSMGGASDSPDLRFCPNRPSLGSSACTTNPGHVQFEYSLVDWQRESNALEREDQLIIADLLARIGIGKQTEVQIGWTAFGTDRERRKGSGRVSQINAIGDVRLAVRRNLRNPDGDGLSFGVEPFAILPLGRQPIGSGDWGAGVEVPITYDLSESVNLAFTGRVAALTDEDGQGRHRNYSGVVGLSYNVSDAITLASEVSVEEDNDPMGSETHVLAAHSASLQMTRRTQLDLIFAAGLTKATPDLRFALGGSILF
ncbi:transporter [Sphingomonas mucosissima]|nr:transporter [Sphingomonas mucosissima]